MAQGVRASTFGTADKLVLRDRRGRRPARARRAGRGARRAALGVGSDARRPARGGRGLRRWPAGRGDARRAADRAGAVAGLLDPAGAGPARSRERRDTPGPAARWSDGGLPAGHGRRGSLGVVAVVLGRAIGAGARGAQSARAALRAPGAATTAAARPGGRGDRRRRGRPWRRPRRSSTGSTPRSGPAGRPRRLAPAHPRHGRARVDAHLGRAARAPLVEAWVTLAASPTLSAATSSATRSGWAARSRTCSRGRGPRPTPTWCCPAASTGSRRRRPLDGADGRPRRAAGDRHGRRTAAARARLPGADGRAGLYGYVSATKWVTELEVTRFADATRVLDRPRLVAARADQDRSRASRCRAGHAGRRRARRRRGDRLGAAPRRHRGAGARRRRAAGATRRSPTTAASTPGGSGPGRWDAEPGEHQLYVRAFDPQGPQTGAEADVIPDGATGYDTVRVKVT